MNTKDKALFIDEISINDLLTETHRESRSTPKEEILRIISKSRQAKGLTLIETAQLMYCEDPDLLGKIYEAARDIKQSIYGQRMVFFAPLYLSSFCVNNCLYCGYRKDNRFVRRRLSMDEIKAEVTVLENMGHKRLALECGEDPQQCTMDYLEEAIASIYSVHEGQGSIRRVNVNIAATTVENYQRLKAAKIGTYILFQETYHRETYAKMHPTGPKAHYDWHTTAHHRAMEAGIDDVGLGILFGLYDWRFEMLALLSHALELEKIFGVGPHTISVPRMRPAFGVDIQHFPHLVNDDDFKKIVAILRLAVPYTGLIISTREEPALRNELFSLGISQLSAGSSTDVGGYSAAKASADLNSIVSESSVPDSTDTPNSDSPESDSSDTDSSHLDSTHSDSSDPDSTYPDSSDLAQSTSATSDSVPSFTPQFTVGDHRSPDELVAELCQSDYLPSFCTACYRQGRTGDRFMALAKTGEIQNVCQPNALLTFKEYLLDYASPATQNIGKTAIEKHLEKVKNPKIKTETVLRLKRLENGERDLYF